MIVLTFEYKNFDGNNKNVIEIVASPIALGLLKRSGNNNIKVCLPLMLSIGKLSNLTPFNRNVLTKYHKNINDYDFTDDFNKLKEFANECIKIRVWASHLDSDEYCLLLLICYLFPDKNISVIFAEENYWGGNIGSVDITEIKELEKREHILTSWQKEDYIIEWQKAVNEDCELRYMINGVVVSTDIDNFDAAIIERLKKIGKVYIFNLVADLMLNPTIPFVVYADWIYVYLIERLEKIGIVKSELIENKKYVELV